MVIRCPDYCEVWWYGNHFLDSHLCILNYNFYENIRKGCCVPQMRQGLDEYSHRNEHVIKHKKAISEYWNSDFQISRFEISSRKNIHLGRIFRIFGKIPVFNRMSLSYLLVFFQPADCTVRQTSGADWTNILIEPNFRIVCRSISLFIHISCRKIHVYAGDSLCNIRKVLRSTGWCVRNRSQTRDWQFFHIVHYFVRHIRITY